MIYLDTHIVVWLYIGNLHKISEEAKLLINNHDLYISPTVRLELQYLCEIKRINDDADKIITDLSERIGLRICDKNYNNIISKAIEATWTRDPFDRLITAHAALNNTILITKDKTILENYIKAVE